MLQDSSHLTVLSKLESDQDRGCPSFHVIHLSNSRCSTNIHFNFLPNKLLFRACESHPQMPLSSCNHLHCQLATFYHIPSMLLLKQLSSNTIPTIYFYSFNLTCTTHNPFMSYDNSSHSPTHHTSITSLLLSSPT